MKRIALLASVLAAVFAVLPGCNRQQQAVTEKPLNDFPTQARVEYVFECMKDLGEQNYDNLYHCVCSIDKIASLMPYEDFSQAQTFSHFMGMAGDRGGEFRDPPQSEKLRARLKEAKTASAQACFPAAVSTPKKGM
ncbi:hypothetical protein F6R98_00675 [Candidatus Methylospira mobilis]|uniref:Uncharacterized protein n=1 Tax=Candidatus Methylospira mobilis TaxID=1808979 RepID=A0A5Q0BBI6_9GAMM|nr:hypothetical protein [Candidatus Methylospira mobilis]QFY41313.1 hypothetical protein F6R98_00675 [Candidatus Methylospira mobilis]WNV05462.1 hypothetical protein RP726_03370 [Candidatus Methylospira mobilis]